MTTRWTQKDIERIIKARVNEPIKSNKINTKDYPADICLALNNLGFSSEREYKFLHDRRFRFDIALPKHKIAIEFEGGVYSNGRHTRGKGYVSDCKKYNLATMHGWKLLRYTTADTKKTNWAIDVAKEIISLIGNR